MPFAAEYSSQLRIFESRCNKFDSCSSRSTSKFSRIGQSPTKQLLKTNVAFSSFHRLLKPTKKRKNSTKTYYSVHSQTSLPFEGAVFCNSRNDRLSSTFTTWRLIKVQVTTTMAAYYLEESKHKATSGRGLNQSRVIGAA